MSKSQIKMKYCSTQRFPSKPSPSLKYPFAKAETSAFSAKKTKKRKRKSKHFRSKLISKPRRKNAESSKNPG